MKSFEKKVQPGGRRCACVCRDRGVGKEVIGARRESEKAKRDLTLECISGSHAQGSLPGAASWRAPRLLHDDHS